MAIDPRTGAAVFARYAMIPNKPTEKMLPPRPALRTLKCVWDGNNKTYCQVMARVRRVLERFPIEIDGEQHTLYGILDYDSLNDDLRKHNAKWQDIWNWGGAHYRWIACFAVTGGSEGHYVHADLIGTKKCHTEDARLNLWLGKTFCGMEAACRVAFLLTHLLGS